MSWNHYALEKIAQERQREIIETAKVGRMLEELPKPLPLTRRLLHRTGAALVTIGFWLQGTQRPIGDLS